MEWYVRSQSDTVSLTHIPTGKQFDNWADAIAYDNSL